MGILLSGNPPFEDDGLYEQILEGKYEFDVDEWTTVSAQAKDIVRRLMTVNPKDRFIIKVRCKARTLTLIVPGRRSSGVVPKAVGVVKDKRLLICTAIAPRSMGRWERSTAVKVK